MKNYEKYADEIREYKVSKGGYFCNGDKPNVGVYAKKEEDQE